MGQKQIAQLREGRKQNLTAKYAKYAEGKWQKDFLVEK